MDVSTENPVLRIFKGEREKVPVCSSPLVTVTLEQMEASGLKVEYIEIRDSDSLRPITTITDQAQLLVAAYAGQVRLIDNIRLKRS